MMLRFTLLIATVVAATHSRADKGEVYLDVSAETEAAWLAHPIASAAPFSPLSSFTLLPRGGLSARLGVTNELHFGLGVEGAAIGNVAARGVTLSGATGDLIAGTYAEMCMPLSAKWRLDVGGDFTGVFELDAGPMLTVWANNALADPTRPDASGLPSRFPIDIADQWNPGAFARISVAFEARFFDVLVVALAPYAGISWAGTPGVHAGIVLRPSFAFSGPT